MRTLRGKQKMVKFEVQGIEPLRRLLDENAGVLITPNHSFHYDSFVLLEASHIVGRPFHFMTAWQVFAMSTRLERWWMQKHGCFSIDRESNDLQAYRQAKSILLESSSPLVIFPEGDIYHTNDRVTPFREGAAAIALGSARRNTRKIACVPCALKCVYVKDPTPQLLRLMDRLEHRLLWRPRPDLPLTERVYRVAEGVLSLKEQEYLGHSRVGTLKERLPYLAESILSRQERYYGLMRTAGGIPERVKELRRTIIDRQEKSAGDRDLQARARFDMDDLFFVTQLYSYPGNYLRRNVSIERIAETLDKFEEDVLRAPIPSVHGQRRVIVRFGEPIILPNERQKKEAVTQLTLTLQQRVQELLDNVNAELVLPQC